MAVKCPVCNNNIPDGSNFCPLCSSDLTKIVWEEDGKDGEVKRAKTGSSSRGRKTKKKKQNPAPLIIAIGLILILVVVIALIVRSMFVGGGLPGAGATPTPETQPFNTSNLIFYTPEPQATAVVFNVVPVDIQVTPTPEPTQEPTTKTYTTLKKGDSGEDVVMLQRALAELGLLASAADGIYGTGTMTAVRNFQTQNGLDVDGIAGSQTQELLFSMVDIEPIVEATAAPGEILPLPG